MFIPKTDITNSKNYPLESAGILCRHKNNTRSNHQEEVSRLHCSLCSHKNTDKHQLASCPLKHAHIQDMSKWSLE